MTLPGYTAAESLYTTSRSYRRAHSGPVSAASATVTAAQQDPCAIAGGGGGGGGGSDLPPTACPRGTRCCGSIVRDNRTGSSGARCLGQCVPFNAQCP